METLFAGVFVPFRLKRSLIPEGFTGGVLGVVVEGPGWFPLLSIPLFVAPRKGFSGEVAAPSKSAMSSELSRDGKDGSA